MKNTFYWIAGITLSLAVLYGFYWIDKTGSYCLFYEDMVKQIIHEIVKQTALK